jgi:putative tricarboxylic transport membrane protein
MILGPILERGIRRTLVASDGNVGVFFQSPIAIVIFILSAALFVVPWILNRRARALEDLSGHEKPETKA